MVHRAALTPVHVSLVAVGLTLAACGQAAAPARSSLAAVSTVAAPPASPAPGVHATGPAAPVAQRPPALKVARLWSTEGTATSPRLPIALAHDGEGHLFVLDAATHRVLVFDDAGQFLRGWGSAGSDVGQFRFRPAHRCHESGEVCASELGGSVAVDQGGHVYVADYGNHRVQVFDDHGHWLRDWGHQGAGAGEFQLPVGIAVDGQSRVYVSDSGNHRIQQFDRSGRFLRQWGGFGPGPGLLASPGTLAVDSRGQVAVVDLGNNRVQQFDTEGHVLRVWVTDPLISTARPETTITVDRHGHLYLASASRLAKLSETGQVLASWGSGGAWDISLVRPSGIAVNGNGTLYIADRDAGRLLKVQQLVPTTSCGGGRVEALRARHEGPPGAAIFTAGRDRHSRGWPGAGCAPRWQAPAGVRLT